MSKHVSIIVAAVIVPGPSPSAHHSPIIFDQATAITVQGTISRYDWTNPHVYIFVETQGAGGQTVEWQFETDATPILLRNGWTRDSLKPGDLVSVRANPDRRANRAHALLISLEREDGTVFTPTAGTSAGARPVTEASTLAGLWEQRFESFIQLNAQARNIPVTEKGAAAKAQYDIRTQNPMAKCIPYTPPMIIATPQYVNQILIREDRVSLRSEFYNVERVVYTDGRGHPEDGERTTQGHSIGWWEDENVLVVDTVLFADHRSTFPGSGLPSGAQKHVVERYALSDDGTRILIDFTVEDPEYLVEPFTGSLEWHHAPHLEFLPFDCDPEQAIRFMLEPALL